MSQSAGGSSSNPGGGGTAAAAAGSRPVHVCPPSHPAQIPHVSSKISHTPPGHVSHGTTMPGNVTERRVHARCSQFAHTVREAGGRSMLHSPPGHSTHALETLLMDIRHEACPQCPQCPAREVTSRHPAVSAC